MREKDSLSRGVCENEILTSAGRFNIFGEKRRRRVSRYRTLSRFRHAEGVAARAERKGGGARVAERKKRFLSFRAELKMDIRLSHGEASCGKIDSRERNWNTHVVPLRLAVNVDRGRIVLPVSHSGV